MSLAARWILSLFFWKSRLDVRLITQAFTLEHLLIMLSDKIWAARAFDELVNLTVATSDQWLVSEQAVKLFGVAGWINHLTILAHRLPTVLRFSIKSMAKMFTTCESRVWNLLRLKCVSIQGSAQWKYLRTAVFVHPKVQGGRGLFLIQSSTQLSLVSAGSVSACFPS